MHPRIGVPCALFKHPMTRQPTVFGVNEPYLRALELAGALPIIIPISDNAAFVARYLDQLNGLLLLGGPDLAPGYYGELPHEHLGEVQRRRDQAELDILRWAMQSRIPILAICRGLQLLNVAFGGSLYQDLPSQRPGDDHEESTRRGRREHLAHTLRLDPQSRLASILGVTELPVNSHHHQGIKQLGAPFCAVGWSADGLVEAIESSSHWVIGVQCHPEDLAAAGDQLWPRLFEAFVMACASS